MLFSQEIINNYMYGDCNIFAIALSRLTGFKMGMIARQLLPEDEFDDFEDLEASHAFLILDDERFLDVQGIKTKSDIITNSGWSFDNEAYLNEPFIKIFNVGYCEDLSSYFASYEEELIEEAISIIKSSDILKLINIEN
jgi:hypothetical protein